MRVMKHAALAGGLMLVFIAGGCRTGTPAVDEPPAAEFFDETPVDAQADGAPGVGLAALPREPGVEAPPAAVLEQTYGLQPGDRVRLDVFQEPDLSGEFEVAGAGTIHHPLLGKVDVLGLTLDGVETRVRERLAADYLVDPRLTVTLLRWAQRPVIVFGEVKSPGAYDIPAGNTLYLLQLVARAGGFTDIASIDRVRIVRATGEKEESRRVKVSTLLKGGGKGDVELMPGDVVIVPKTIF